MKVFFVGGSLGGQYVEAPQPRNPFFFNAVIKQKSIPVTLDATTTMLVSQEIEVYDFDSDFDAYFFKCIENA